MSTKYLLVEGMADLDFFTSCCEKAGLGKKVKVSPPKDLGAEEGGKGNAICLLPDLIEQMNDGSVTGLALIVDADYDETNGLGCQKTREKIEGIIEEHGYAIDGNRKHKSGGFCFPHNNGLPDFGLWIMPNNKSDGFLEDFIKSSIIQSESNLLAHANKTVAKISEPKFKPLHKSKAEVATWMAWQTMPGQPLVGAVGGNLLDFNNGQAKGFIDWLKHIFG